MLNLYTLQAIINDKEKIIPDGIRKILFLSTGTACDNFNINTQTPSGKDIIPPHIWDMLPKNVVGDFINIQAEVPPEKTNRKRRFSKVPEPTEIEIEPYRKKKQLNLQFDFQVIDVRQPPSYALAISYDTLWMISSNLLPLIPIWAGWNSIKVDSQMKQSLQYMHNIQLPQTIDD